jgi:pyruvate kinase
MLPSKNPPLLIAKIETPRAVERIEKIIDVADGIMIARGDLGLSVPMAEVPFIQKALIRLALRKAKPVITATQMLESMMHNSLPTRAEVSDVTKAILDGTDATMLSGETARGQFPEEVVETMANIIMTASPHIAPRDFPEEDYIADAVSASAVKMAAHVKAKLIIVLTQTGATARRLSRHRPSQPIIALSPIDRTLRHLIFSFGVCPVKIGSLKTFDELIPIARKVAMQNDVMPLKKGDRFVISAGVPFGVSGTTNLVLVEKV